MSAEQYPPIGGEEAANVANSFRLEGEYWTISYDAMVIRLRDSKGLRYIVHLLRHPGRRFSSTELLDCARSVEPAVESNGTPADGDPSDAERARSAVGKRIRAALAKIGVHHPALGRHLERTIRTGRLCGYLPHDPVAWNM